jgi:hypothetical protein
MVRIMFRDKVGLGPRLKFRIMFKVRVMLSVRVVLCLVLGLG